MTKYETADAVGRFTAGEIVRVRGERGTFTVKSFRNDLGGWTAFVVGNGAIRCFAIDRLHAVSKKRRATAEASS